MIRIGEDMPNRIMAGNDEVKAVYIGDVLLWPEDIDDAARSILKEGWRMPTMDEFQELIDNCSWTWKSINGINGYSVSGNGNYIFLPASGFRYNSDSWAKNGRGFYWSSVKTERGDPWSRSLEIRTDSVSVHDDYRYYGMTIRPVNRAKGVDLGVSVRWGASNLTLRGFAANASDSGDYFAWGETEPNPTFTESDYKFFDPSTRIYTKYNGIDKRTILI